MAPNGNYLDLPDYDPPADPPAQHVYHHHQRQPKDEDFDYDDYNYDEGDEGAGSGKSEVTDKGAGAAGGFDMDRFVALVVCLFFLCILFFIIWRFKFEIGMFLLYWWRRFRIWLYEERYADPEDSLDRSSLRSSELSVLTSKGSNKENKNRSDEYGDTAESGGS